MRTGPVGRFGLGCRVIFAAGHDTGAVASAGGQNAVVPYQVESRRRYEGGQFLEQFHG